MVRVADCGHLPRSRDGGRAGEVAGASDLWMAPPESSVSARAPGAKRLQTSRAARPRTLPIFIGANDDPSLVRTRAYSPDAPIWRWRAQRTYPGSSWGIMNAAPSDTLCRVCPQSAIDAASGGGRPEQSSPIFSS